jgi:hypothetical protein
MAVAGPTVNGLMVVIQALWQAGFVANMQWLNLDVRLH